MMGNLGLKDLNDESVTLLDDLYDKLTAKRGFCYFCPGGNTCICGHCCEGEYHDTDCLVVLLDRLLWNYRHPPREESHTLVLTTKEQLDWYKKRIVELEELTGNIDY